VHPSKFLFRLFSVYLSGSIFPLSTKCSQKGLRLVGEMNLGTFRIHNYSSQQIYFSSKCYQVHIVSSLHFPKNSVSTRRVIVPNPSIWVHIFYLYRNSIKQGYGNKNAIKLHCLSKQHSFSPYIPYALIE